MDLMEFSMTEGNDTLTGDENFLPPQLMQTPVVVNSILKPSTKGNLMQLHTPKPQQKNLKVKFETPRSVKKVTPTRYEKIADLDEKENWIERTAIVTKTDHMLNIECARDILDNLVEKLPILKSESTTEKPGNESDDETFFDASDDTEKATSDTLGYSGPASQQVADTLPVSAPQQVVDTLPVSASQQVVDTLPVSAPQQVVDTLPVSAPQQVVDTLPVSAPQQVGDTLPVSAPQQVVDTLPVSAPHQVANTLPVSALPAATGILDVSMECCEAEDLVDDEPMDCDETAIETTVICNKTLVEDKALGQEIVEDNPVTLVKSPPLPASKGAYSIDFDNLDSFNPFQTKAAMTNSPVLNVEKDGKAEDGGKDVAEQAPLKTDAVEGILDSQAPEGILDIEVEVDTDLLSEVLPDVGGGQEQGIYSLDFDENTDPFATKSQVTNSPFLADALPTKLPAHSYDVNSDIRTVCDSQSFPVNEDVTTPKRPLKADDSDPFSTKSKVMNSPTAVLNNSNPFATKANVCNSPILPPDEMISKSSQLQTPIKNNNADQLSLPTGPESLDTVHLSNYVTSPAAVVSVITSEKTLGVEVSDPMSMKPNMANLSSSSLAVNELNSCDPFATKSSVLNSPVPGAPKEENLFVSNVKTSDSLEVSQNVSSQSDEEKISDIKYDLDIELFARAPDSQMVSGSENTGGNISTDKSNTDKQSAPATETDLEVGTVKVLENDPITTISKVPSSPPSLVTARKDPLADLDPFSTKSNVANSPTPAQATDDPMIDPFSTKSKVANSPTPAQATDDPMIDPFSTKSKVANSPASSAKPTEDPMIDPFSTKSKVANSPTPAQATDDPMIDPFSTKSKVANSPASSAKPTEDPMIDPFSTKSKVANSPTPSAKPTEDPMIDPFSTKSKVANSPTPAQATDDPMIDPFSTKSKVANSPTPAQATDDPMIDSFSTKSKVANSPASSAKPTEDPMIDPFSTKSKVANSPTPAQATDNPMIDPFSTKSKVANSPTPAQATDNPMIDPFSTKSKVANSPASSAKPTEDPMIDPFSTKSNVANSPTPAKATDDPMIDPFSSKSKVANSPIPSAKPTDDPMIDPFSTKSKVANSPASSAKPTDDPMIDPFSSKSKVANSPTPAKATDDPMIDPFSTKSKVPNSPSSQAPTEVKVSNLPGMMSQTAQQVGLSSSENKFPEGEFPNITKERTVQESASSVPDFSDEEFRPATECLFNDASFLDVLEKFGSSNTESKASDLARMSLYVKFDPLVDLPAADPRRASMNLLKRASIMNMPRRSLSGKSLYDVCNAEESMLLMGTPPKQMSRLANISSRPQHTGFTPGSIPTTPKAFKPQLDLLCANTPPRSVKKSTTPAPVKVNSNLPEEPADNLAGGSDDNIIEVLQYTDKDMCELKTSLFLEFQGQKLLLEREWTKVVDKLKAKIEEQNKTLEKKQADIELMGNISKELENIVEGLIQEKENGKTATTELQKERDQAVQDTQSLEKAFSELHRRNEKLKEALSGYVKNQETLTAHAKELQKALTGVKTESKEKITELAQQLAKAKSDLNLITTSSEARTKRDKLQIESLQKTVDQKMSENKELTQMCDELLAKVST
ncbi:mucin-2-like isoform X2 [Pecten maximus]|uniref:mucin-2-like isoform X2 n=1 Tax=Pecten maximus TaxID=6579 RepID=UPI001457EB5C|nr:mucin-2-like isoform X2 [Pecten maximus]